MGVLSHFFPLVWELKALFKIKRLLLKLPIILKWGREEVRRGSYEWAAQGLHYERTQTNNLASKPCDSLHTVSGSQIGRQLAKGVVILESVSWQTSVLASQRWIKEENKALLSLHFISDNNEKLSSHRNCWMMTPNHQGLPSMCHSPEPQNRSSSAFSPPSFLPLFVKCECGEDQNKEPCQRQLKMTAQKSVNSVCWGQSRELHRGEEKCEVLIL